MEQSKNIFFSQIHIFILSPKHIITSNLPPSSVATLSPTHIMVVAANKQLGEVMDASKKDCVDGSCWLSTMHPVLGVL
jgi:hypothetical protein